MRLRLSLWTSVALWGCDPSFIEPPATDGTASGAVRVFQGTNSSHSSARVDAALKSKVLSLHNSAPQRPFAQRAAMRLAPAAAARPRLGMGGPARTVDSETPIRPGEVIVRFTERISATEAKRRLRVDGLTFRHGGFASEYLHLAVYNHADGSALAESQTRELVASLQRRAGVKFTEPNGMRQALVAPNDNLYPAMWHLPPINLAAAWDLEKGSGTTVTIAVIDTGYLPHPDLADRIAQGYDMITEPSMSVDGDGRDADATDPGKDAPNGGSSYHGTHCAGTIGASTNNGTGIAGVNWNARIVPVRVLGKGGGTDFDIAAGMAWASGGTVPGTPANANPASVVSMSLGGFGGPLRTYQDAIDDATTRNVIFAIAAGNENTDASKFTPCNQSGVLCIGATRFNGKRSSYSNYGDRVDLMAPGGEMAEDLNGDGYADGVLSLSKDDGRNEYFYKFENGTSMAAPHIAGVVSLLKAKRPSVTFTEVKQALISTANADSRCNEGCGAGLVNVLAALQQIAGSAPMGPARLSLSATEFFFTPGNSAATLQITNSGGQPLDVQLSLQGTDANRVTLGSAAVSVPAGATRPVALTANLDGLATGASASAVLSVASNGGMATVNLKLRVLAVSDKPAAVALVFLDSKGEWQVAKSTTAMAPALAFSISAPAGKYYVFGVQDSNGDGMFQDNEPIGLYPNTSSPKEITLASGQMLTGLNFTLAPEPDITDTSGSVIGTACTDNTPCAPGICGTGFPGGYCTQNCAMQGCPLGSRCIAGASASFCLASCPGVRAGRSDCRVSYVCEDDGTGSGVCLPACTQDDDCAPSTCDTASGYCR